MHGAGQWGTFGALFNGNTVVLISKFDPHEVWRLVEREKVMTIAVTGDAMARPMVEALREGNYDTSSVIAFSSTAAVFSPSIKDEYLELLPNAFVTEAIGATETGFSGLTMHQKGQKARGGGPTVNIGPDTLVIDDDGHPIPPGSERIGRIARSGNVPLRYHKDPEKTAATFITIDGVRYSIPGDFARVEEDGTVTLLGRGSNCINSGGEKIFPEEVEGALKSHPEVFDAIVVGVPDERFGSKVAAVVQAREGKAPTLEDLDAHVRTKIAGYKVPRELHLVDEVRRQPSGKPDYPWAQEYALKARADA
jgi:acyl-CoA synthetase (AMP-forming)/AMP-acid ligase II